LLILNEYQIKNAIAMVWQKRQGIENLK